MVLSKELHFQHIFILGINKWSSTQKSTYKITIGVRIMWGEVTQPNQLIIHQSIEEGSSQTKYYFIYPTDIYKVYDSFDPYNSPLSVLVSREDLGDSRRGWKEDSGGRGVCILDPRGFHFQQGHFGPWGGVLVGEL